jgi:hypothetical protein
VQTSALEERVEWNENKAGTIESSLTEVRDVVQQSTDASKKILVILETMSKAIRTGLKVCLKQRELPEFTIKLDHNLGIMFASDVSPSSAGHSRLRS